MNQDIWYYIFTFVSDSDKIHILTYTCQLFRSLTLNTVLSDIKHTNLLFTIPPHVKISSLTTYELPLHHEHLIKLHLNVCNNKIGGYDNIIYPNLQTLIVKNIPINIRDSDGEYATTIHPYVDLNFLFKMPSLISLQLLGCHVVDNFSNVSKLNQLTTLDINSDINYKDLEVISTLSNLTSLVLSGRYNFNTLQPLSNLSKLQTLKLNDRSGSSISNLHDLPISLTDLDLCGFLGMHTLSSLNNHNLKRITLELYNECDISILCNMSMLTHITVYNCVDLRDISHIFQIPSATHIHLICGRLRHKNIKISLLPSVRDLTIKASNNTVSFRLDDSKLETLDCSNTLYNINGLNLLTNLKLHLTKLNYNQIFIKSAFTNFTQLVKLHLTLDLSISYKAIDLKIFNLLINLKSLTLDNFTNFTHLYSLTTLQHLEQLHLSKCYQLHNIKSLINLTKLSQLSLKDCNVLECICVLADIHSLNICNISGKIINICDTTHYSIIRNIASLKCEH